MRVTAFAVNTSASSIAKQFHRVLLRHVLLRTRDFKSRAYSIILLQTNSLHRTKRESVQVSVPVLKVFDWSGRK